MARDGSANRQRILDTAERLVLERGFAATSVDAVIEGAGTTKGGFFHHFPSKARLGRALVERYAAADLALLHELTAAAEAAADDPAERLVAFLDGFLERVGDVAYEQPGCLYVSFLHERQLVDEDTIEVIARTALAWRERIRAMLDAAATVRPPRKDVDLASLADLPFTTFEGGFVLARTMADPALLRTQLVHLRTYVELLFDLQPRAGTSRRAPEIAVAAP